LGFLLMGEGELQEATTLLSDAIKIDPNDASSYMNLCAALDFQHKTDEAVPFCRKAITLDPKLIEAHSLLAMVLEDSGNHDEALIYGRKATELDPENADASYKLGLILEHQDNLMEAEKVLEKAVLLGGPQHFANDALARVRQKNRNPGTRSRSRVPRSVFE